MNAHDRCGRVLITGGAGFLGAHVAGALIQNGTKVVVADWQAVDMRTPLKSFGLSSSVEYLQVDVSNWSAVEKSISGEFDTIFHLAAQPIGWISQVMPSKTMTCNVESTRVMLDFVRRGRARHFILVSSACVFGIPDRTLCPLDEYSLMDDGQYPYTRSKQQAEQLVLESGIRASIARFCNLFGEGDWHSSRIVPRIVRQLLNGQPLSLSRSSGQSLLDFLYVKDAVSALLCLESRVDQLSSLRSTEIFNFGPEMPISILKLVEKLCFAFDGEIRTVEIPHFKAEHEIHKYLCSARARQHLGWQPQVEREAALRRTIRWYARYGATLDDPERTILKPISRVPSSVSVLTESVRASA